MNDIPITTAVGTFAEYLLHLALLKSPSQPPRGRAVPPPHLTDEETEPHQGGVPCPTSL